MLPPGRLLAATALVTLLGTGCASTPAETGSGGAGGGNDVNEKVADGENAVAEAGPAPERKGRLAEFAECMRANGVEDFPDPDADGVIQFRGGTDTPEFKSARENCRAVLPEGLGVSEGAAGGGG